ncbi:hypothetical protein [Streptomyces flavidovirens]|uniref:Uncharacterized protein n=1 Tax=Streptomyces flavidovirens TaxID=67298 RepID=A0ABW6RKL1_9ACTN
MSDTEMSRAPHAYTLDAAADLAERLLSRPEPEETGYNAVRIKEFAYEWSVQERGQAFREVMDAITGRVGQPAWCGGSAGGPQVRWRSGQWTLVLDGRTFGADLSVHPSGELERMDCWYFDYGVGDGEEQVSSYDDLPYLWLLHRHEGERLVGGCRCLGMLPVMRLVTNWEDLEESLGMLLAAWSEQLPAMVGDWAGFQLYHSADDHRCGVVGFEPGTGLFTHMQVRDGDESPERESAMRDLGWQERTEHVWKAEFPEPGQESGEALARLLIADARARGARSPADMKVRDISCGDDGYFVLPALGLGY